MNDLTRMRRLSLVSMLVTIAFLAGCAVPTPVAPTNSAPIEAPSATVPAEPEAPPVTPATVAVEGDAKSAGNIFDVALATNSLKTLVAAVQAAGLVDTLKGAGPFTVFAPTDDAFVQLGQATLDSLLKPENKEKLAAILTYHVVPGKVVAADVVKLTGAETVQGSKIAIKVEGDTVMINDAKVVQADIETSNGVIHVIDKVISPPVAAAQPATTTPILVKDAQGNDVEIKDASRIVSLGGARPRCGGGRARPERRRQEHAVGSAGR